MGQPTYSDWSAIGSRDAYLSALRATAEAAAARRYDQHEQATWQQELVDSYQATCDAYRRTRDRACREHGNT